MSALLEGIDAAALLQHMPSSMRASLETLERAGTDWNMVGTLLVATPTSGVVLAGTGQWTMDLWDAVKWEFRGFLCTESEAYAELRTEWDALKQRSPALAVRSLATIIGTRIGVTDRPAGDVAVRRRAPRRQGGAVPGAVRRVEHERRRALVGTPQLVAFTSSL